MVLTISPVVASFNNPLIFLVDIIFLVTIASITSWYFYYYQKKEIFGNFLGGAIISVSGAVLLLILQKPIRDFIMWLMSPKVGSDQLSRVNIIVASLGAYLAMYLLYKISKKKE
jgi:hypothetical protein